MQKYRDVVIASDGSAVSGASVTVTLLAGSTPTIYSDNGSTVAANPLTTDGSGGFSFYGADGRYSLSISGAGITTTTVTDILLEDPASASTHVITGGTIDGTPVGSVTPSTGAFTTLTASGALSLEAGLVLPKTTNVGIKVDTATPTFGWRDIIGSVSPKASGAGAPTRAVYAGANIADYSFAANDTCDFVFHIPHDYAPGTDLHFHVHWSHNGTTTTGNAVFTVYHTYASRTVAGTTIFPAQKTNTITWATVDVATTPQYAHRVDEIPITSAAGSAALTANTLIEVDGLLLVNIVMTTLPTLGGAGKLFIHTCDLHYQSTNMATKSSGPDYYT